MDNIVLIWAPISVDAGVRRSGGTCALLNVCPHVEPRLDPIASSTAEPELTIDASFPQSVMNR